MKCFLNRLSRCRAQDPAPSRVTIRAVPATRLGNRFPGRSMTARVVSGTEKNAALTISLYRDKRSSLLTSPAPLPPCLPPTPYLPTFPLPPCPPTPPSLPSLVLLCTVATVHQILLERKDVLFLLLIMTCDCFRLHDPNTAGALPLLAPALHPPPGAEEIVWYSS